MNEENIRSLYICWILDYLLVYTNERQSAENGYTKQIDKRRVDERRLEKRGAPRESRSERR